MSTECKIVCMHVCVWILAKCLVSTSQSAAYAYLSDVIKNLKLIIKRTVAQITRRIIVGEHPQTPRPQLMDSRPELMVDTIFEVLRLGSIKEEGW